MANELKLTEIEYFTVKLVFIKNGNIIIIISNFYYHTGFLMVCIHVYIILIAK